ncbi:hypothetical protein [Methanotorris formicicus]|uniref:Uncharacterized protein n=1 Tax=Methanotorris formicicus Mc-S-70 TaxID=647171 RepID=H1L0X0_9EURY|nr:hypothetical protein MetfoDRAFT_1694 [Methanotorris formicicus Mc-S-70]
MKKPSFIFLTFLILILTNSINAVEFTSIDYKNEYLEPGKTYDIWVVITPDKEINNTVLSITPYGISKEYIQIIKGVDYEGHLFQNEKGIGHFIIKIKITPHLMIMRLLFIVTTQKITNNTQTIEYSKFQLGGEQ